MANDEVAKKKASALTKAAPAAAAALAWPTGGYNSFIPYLLVHVLAVYMLFIDVSSLCTVHASMLRYRYELHTVIAMFTAYSWIRLVKKVLIFPTIQKPYFRHFSTHGFVATLKPEKFTGTHFKRWQTRTTLWLTAMNMFLVGGVSPTVTIAPEQENAFREATTIFVGAVLTMIGDKLVDAYLHMRVAKNLWDALEAKFGATDAGSELYAMEKFHDYKRLITILYWTRPMRYNASLRSWSSRSVSYRTSLSRVALLQTPSWMEELCYFSQALET